VFPIDNNIKFIDHDHFHMTNVCSFSPVHPSPLPTLHLSKKAYTCAGLGITINNDNLTTEDKQRLIDLLDNNSDRFASSKAVRVIVKKVN